LRAFHDSMRWTFAAEAPAPSQARAAARAFAAQEGADADTLAAIALCVSEAVSNAVIHAYRKSERPGAIEVEVKRPNGYLCLRVRDHGCGLAPRVDSPGLGLGLPLIAESAASMEVVTPGGGGTELRMRFDLHTAAHTTG
jgi:serine/threonine-protein kinase RsbW